MKIRKATLKDLKKIKALCRKDNFELNRDWKSLISSKTSEVFVVEDKKQLIAVTGLMYMAWNNTIKISNIFVSPEHRRKGIGADMILFLIKRAKKTKYRCIIAEAPSRNPVIKLYKKLGFRKCGYNDRLYSNSGKEKAIWMSIDLKK